jgi:hypothetical protein
VEKTVEFQRNRYSGGTDAGLTEADSGGDGRSDP